MIHPVQDVEEPRVESGLEDQAQQVGPPQAPPLLARVGVQVRAVVLLHVLGVLPLTEFDVCHHHQRRAGDKNELQRPQADVGDGEDVVVADVGAAGLEGKENKVTIIMGSCTIMPLKCDKGHLPYLDMMI